MAMAFQGTIMQPHFEKTSFRINKKIFATLDEKNATATFKFNEIDQSVFCSIPQQNFHPANGAWGKQGWTIVDLTKISKSILADALKKSFLNVSQKK